VGRKVDGDKQSKIIVPNELTRPDAAKEYSWIKEVYDKCFPGHSHQLIDSYFNVDKDKERWRIFKSKYGFVTYNQTYIGGDGITSILNERSDYKDQLLAELNKMDSESNSRTKQRSDSMLHDMYLPRSYYENDTSKTNICISETKCVVYWIHSLCVAKTEINKGNCRYVQSELVAIKNISCSTRLYIVVQFHRKRFLRVIK